MALPGAILFSYGPASMRRFRESDPRVTVRILTCSTKHAGTVAQVEGVALAVARKITAEDGRPVEIVRHHWRHDLLLHVPLLSRSRHFDVIISSGSSGARKALRQRASIPASIWVHLEALVYRRGLPDLHAVPAHDWRDEFQTPAHLKMAGSPHRVRREDVEQRRLAARERQGVLPGERVAVFLIGGTSRAFAMDMAAAKAVARQLERVAGSSYRCFVTLSRRSPPQARAVLEAVRHPAITIWDGTGDNPYLDYLAIADCLFVTEDSISMTCEAAMAGRPLYRLALTPLPGPALEKLRRFQSHWSAFQLPAEAFRPDAEWGDRVAPDDAEAVAARTVELMRRLT